MDLGPIPTLVELFRADPTTSSLLLFGPLSLAAGQLLNSYVNGVSPIVAIAFAVAMVAFAVVATGHHAAEHHRRTLESEFGPAN
ncbi:hypothetical protein ACFO5R_15695 [Halosolutus amylolyticus]|uniref:Uncharacterized protein n=1 Tax=Halosolutus amylolyticus TaxID=2932267 RepID=A0ABD5PSC5_9EURY|nr:hypothetical protein [Halosolutus amylolyticus]